MMPISLLHTFSAPTLLSLLININESLMQIKLVQFPLYCLHDFLTLQTFAFTSNVNLRSGVDE